MRRRFVPATIAALCFLTMSGVSAVELKPPTLAAFDRYVRVTEARMSGEISGASPFLWLDRQPERDRAAVLARLKMGEVISESLETFEGSTRIKKVRDGRIHHWIGTVLLPNASLARVRTFVQGYDRYHEFFAPTIQRSRVVSRTPDQFTVAMRTPMTKLGYTVVIDADYRIDYRAIGPSRLYTKSIATNVFDVKNADQPDEQRIPGDQAVGWLWRLNTYCSFEERPEGTYEQCESISVTRGVPFLMAPLVKLLVGDIPKETLDFTLGRVRAEMLKPALLPVR